MPNVSDYIGQSYQRYSTGARFTVPEDPQPPYDPGLVESDQGVVFYLAADGTLTNVAEGGGAIGPEGPPGPEGPQGDPGPAGSEGPVGPQGPIGPEGPQGGVGPGVNFKGTVQSEADLPPTAAQGDAYRVLDTDDVWVWDSVSGWGNLGPVQGPEGPQGIPGPAGPQGPSGMYFVECTSTGGMTGHPAGWTLQKLGIGQYRINHNLGIYNTYGAVVCVSNRNGTPVFRHAQFQTRDNDFVVVHTFDVSGNATDASFEILFWDRP